LTSTDFSGKGLELRLTFEDGEDLSLDVYHRISSRPNVEARKVRQSHDSVACRLTSGSLGGMARVDGALGANSPAYISKLLILKSHIVDFCQT
jgi:hypothetical protein